MGALTLAAALAAGTPPDAFGPVPSPRQLRYQSLEQCMFIHFGVNTFSGEEWGHGTESPASFNPTALDCRQWARIAKEAGLRGIVITAKHHDGFCLWPSALTEHSVKASPWRGGKGDLLAELSQACREAGIGFGVYLSPWDRNNPRYGTGEEYNAYFAAQLRDVLTSYGKVFEVWFDGACGEGPDGRRQTYDWKRFVGVVRECQPDAVIFSDAGPDTRWVGNESGVGCETNWCRLTLSEFFPGIPGRNEVLCSGQRDGADWIPAEVDVSIRPGWFWRASEDNKVKSADALEKIWFESVGRGCNLLLNVPVDNRGLIADPDARVLREWGERLRERAAHDIADTAEPRWDAPTSTLTLSWSTPVRPRTIRVEERVELGQRVEAFRVDTRDRAAPWREIARGTTIGPRRIIAVDATPATEIRIVIESARAQPLLGRVSIYE